MSTSASTSLEPRALPSPPTDGITCLSYLPQSSSSPSSPSSSPPSSSSILAASSWDGTVRLYDTKSMSNVCTRSMDSGPILSLAVDGNGDALFTGGLDGSVRRFDIATNTVTTIGHHSPHIDVPSGGTSGHEEQVACSCLSPLFTTDASSSSTSVLASAGWDSNFYLWDVRMNNNNNTNANGPKQKPAAHIQLPNKAYSMDVDPSTGTRIVVATAGRRTCFIDVRMNTNAIQQQRHDDDDDEENTDVDSIIKEATLTLNRESTLKYQTRVCRFFPDGNGIAVGSIEGRVAIEFLSEEPYKKTPPNNMKKYAFKCHRVKDVVYPVNTISFHNTYGTFVTGGCDGSIVSWDGLHKKKLSSLCHTNKFPTSISALCFHPNGHELAIASSYTFEEGERDHPRDEIYIRNVLDSEIMPKSMSKKS